MTTTTVGVRKLRTGPDSVDLREFTVDDPGPGQVLLEVISAGICGTDLHIADDEFPSDPPVTMGHEVTGEVRSVGEGVDDDLIGERFAAETYFSYCETCTYCRTGSPNLCRERRSFGSHVDGGFARWLILPARNLHRLPDHVARHAGSLAEPLACVANCLFDPSFINAGDTVLVLGPGTMGVLTAQASRAAGGNVVLAGLPSDDQRLAIANRLGLTTITIGDEPISDEAYDVVCECSGAEPAAATALRAVRKGGRYVHVGIFGHDVTLNLDQILYKEITYTSGFASTPRSWARAMSLLESGAVELDPLVSEVVPIAEWQRAFEATRAGTGMKFVIDPRSEGK
ncbi:MAG: zinc-dependent alcohol dehydrogenase [Acidimicrobiia bacterium]